MCLFLCVEKWLYEIRKFAVASFGAGRGILFYNSWSKASCLEEDGSHRKVPWVLVRFLSTYLSFKQRGKPVGQLGAMDR
jgi:hypothetical protein